MKRILTVAFLRLNMNKGVMYDENEKPSYYKNQKLCKESKKNKKNH